MKQIASAMMLTIIALPALAQQTLGVVTSVATCSAPAPTTLDDGWLTDRPENVGLDGARLCGIADRMTAANANVHAVVVARRGKLVYEHYSSGYDEPWGEPDRRYDFSAATKHDMRSISKSVTSLLVGIAIDRKLIAGADEPVVNFFPEHAAVRSAGWGGITIRHLLTMSSGMAWDENLPWTDPKNDEPHLGTQADPIRYVLSKPIAVSPGTIWNYNGGGTDLLGASSSAFQASRSRPSRARRCSSRWASPTGNGSATATARLPRRRAFACARAMPPSSASWCSIAARGKASRLSRQPGLQNRSRQDIRPSAISAACFSMDTTGGWVEHCRGTKR